MSSTACLTSLPFQQYRNGFMEELNIRNVNVTAPEKARDGVSNAATYSKAAAILYGR